MKDENNFLKIFEFADFKVPDFEDWKKVLASSSGGKDWKKFFRSNEGLQIAPMYSDYEQAPKFSFEELATFPYSRGISKKGSSLIGFDFSQVSNSLEFVDLAINQGAQALDFEVFGPGRELFSKIDFSRILACVDCGADAESALWALKFLKKNEFYHYVSISPLASLSLSANDELDVEKVLGDYFKDPDIVEKSMAKNKSICVQFETYHNAGADVVLSLALMMSEVNYYYRILTKKGIDANKVASLMYARLSLDTMFFHNIVTLRAARLLYALICFNLGVDKKNCALHTVGVVSKRAKTVSEPELNLLRQVLSICSGQLGGAQIILTDLFDITGKIDIKTQLRLAINSVLIAQEECGLTLEQDSFGGSYMVETMTMDLSKKAYDLFVQIENKGGIIEATSTGWVASMIKERAQVRQREIAMRKRVITGVNSYLDIDLLKSDIAQVEPSELEKKGDKRLKRISAEYELLHFNVLKFKKKTGTLPRALILCIKDFKDYGPRVAFSKDFMSAGGFEVDLSPFVNTIEEAIVQLEKVVNVVILCSLDENYSSWVPLILKHKPANTLFLIAGRPGEFESQWKKDGCDGYIFMGKDNLKTLNEILERICLNG
jgi:methylmalonyl-CoA mutase